MNDSILDIFKHKGFIKNKDGSYSKICPMDTKAQSPLVEFPVWHNPVGTPRSAKKSPARLRICITGYYIKPLDDCNMVTKQLVDCLRYATIIIDDNWGNIRVTSEQFKVEKEEEEGTLIEIEEVL